MEWVKLLKRQDVEKDASHHLDVTFTLPQVLPHRGVRRPWRHRKSRRGNVGKVVEGRAEQGRRRLVLAVVHPDEGGGALEDHRLEDRGQGEDDEAGVGVVLKLHEGGDDGRQGLAGAGHGGNLGGGGRRAACKNETVNL